MRLVDLQVAAAVAGPAGAPAGSTQAADPAAVVAILRANKVPLMDIDPPDHADSPVLAPILRTEIWDSSVRHERAERDALAAEFSRLSARLRARGITPILFKSAGGIPYRSSNVDLLVGPGDMKAAAHVLDELGHLRFPHYREDHKLLYRRFRGGRSVICVHLHDAVSWGKVLILPGDDVSARSRMPRGSDRTGEFKVASAEDLLIITLAHALYETDQIRLSDLRAIRLACSEKGFDPRQVEARVARRGWTRGFHAMLARVERLERSLYGETRLPPEWRTGSGTGATSSTAVQLPFAMSKRFTKRHYIRFIMTNPDRSGDERIADLFATGFNLAANRLQLRCRPAVAISLSGLDGSGKSSALRACLETYTLCEIPVRAVWSRGGFTSWMETAKKVARTAMPDAIPGPGQTDAKRRWLGRPLPAALFALAVAVEQSVHYVLRVRLPMLAGTSMLCDRYAWDTQADLEAKIGSGGRVAAWSGALVAAAAPRPDLAILLRLDPDAASRRKPEDAHMAHLLPSQAASLDRLARNHNLVVIDAGRPLEEVIDDVVDLALRAAFRKFSGE